MDQAPLATVPEPLTFTRPMLDAWFSLPPDDYIEVSLTRRDFDALFSAFRNSIESQDSLDEAIVRLTRNDLQNADVAMNNSRRQRVESLNAFKRFFMAVMTAAGQTTQHA